MALYKSIQVANNAALLSADDASDIVAVAGDFTIPAGLAANDVVEMVGLPAGYVPVDLIVDVPVALGTTLTADIGILSGLYQAALDMSGGARVCGSEFNSAAALASAGIIRPTKPGANSIAPVTDAGTVVAAYAGTLYDRGIGFKASAVAALTAGTKVRFTLLYRPQVNGV